jgi:hypothetical protein
MRLSRAFIAAATAALALDACGGGSSTPTPIALPSPTPTPASTSSAVTLVAATSSTCVTAQATPQTVTLPDTGGITASLAFAQYDTGATGCQNITIATGSAAAATGTPLSTARSIQSASSAPIVSMTLGEGLPTSLGLATVMSGATLSTDANLNFPDGTYNATVQIAAYGVNTSVQLSLVFAASHGKLTITGGTQLPVNLGGGAKLLIYDRGVVPPGFIQPTPSPSPSSSASATPSPAPSASLTATPVPTPTPLPTSQPGVPVPDGTTIGTFSDTISGLPNNSYGNGITYSGTIVYGNPPAGVNNLQCVQNQQTGDNTCVYTGSTFDAGIASGGGVLPGTATYTINGLPAKSYRIEGCTGDVGYGGNGITGTFTIPFKTFAFSDDCYVNLYSQPASVVNTPPDYGSAYMLFSIVGPVATGDTNANPAVNIP